VTSPNRNQFDPLAGEKLAEQLAAPKLPYLDFDQLRHWLLAASQKCRTANQHEHDLQLLREDYQARITGMLKAIAIAERSRSRLDSLADLIDSLGRMSVEDLILCYRKTGAIFRDHFPGAIGQKP
jgi:hypothetical protein